jgi:hypothetical protein
MSTPRLLGAAVVLAVVCLILGQFSWPIAILVTAFTALVVPFMTAIFTSHS